MKITPMNKESEFNVNNIFSQRQFMTPTSFLNLE